MLYLLLEKKKITAKELAQRFEVSTRTIYRDVEILSNAQIPIYTTKGKGGGICLLEEYVFDKALLSEKEQNQILFALQSMNKIGIKEEEILDKVSRMFQKEKNNWIEVDFSEWGTDRSKNHTFELIKEAILKQQVIKIHYFNSYGEESIRKVEPIQIYFKSKSWYLIAYCRKKEEARMFKIRRIQDIEILEEKFQKRKTEELVQEPEFKMIHLELEIVEEMAYRVYDEFPKESIKKQKNGNFTVIVEYPEGDWIDSFILSFGETIKIIKPDSIKNRIKNKLEKSLRNY